MKSPKLLMGLFGVSILIGCGSDSDDSTSSQGGAEYRGSVEAATVSEEKMEFLQADADAVVKAITFVRYEENVADYYRNKHLVPLELTEMIGSILEGASELINDYAGDASISGESVPGECGGVVIASGNSDSFSGDANDYCDPLGSSGDTISISGTLSYNKTEVGYGMSFNKVSMDINYISEEQIDQTTFINGSVNYSETEAGIALNVDAYVEVDDISSSANVTYTCPSKSCQFDADFKAENGVTYRVEDLQASLNTTYGYTGWGELYLPDHGYLDLYYYHVTFCEDGSIGNGYIEMKETDSNKTIEVRYDDCGEFVTNYAPEGIPK